MPRALAQDQLGALASGLDVVAQVRAVDLAPDGVSFLDRFALGEIRVTMKVRFGILEHGFAKLQETSNVPALDRLLFGIDVNREIEKVADENARAARWTAGVGL